MIVISQKDYVLTNCHITCQILFEKFSITDFAKLCENGKYRNEKDQEYNHQSRAIPILKFFLGGWVGGWG